MTLCTKYQWPSGGVCVCVCVCICLICLPLDVVFESDPILRCVVVVDDNDVVVVVVACDRGGSGVIISVQ